MVEFQYYANHNFFSRSHSLCHLSVELGARCSSNLESLNFNHAFMHAVDYVKGYLAKNPNIEEFYMQNALEFVKLSESLENLHQVRPLKLLGSRIVVADFVELGKLPEIGRWAFVSPHWLVGDTGWLVTPISCKWSVVHLKDMLRVCRIRCACIDHLRLQ